MSRSGIPTRRRWPALPVPWRLRRAWERIRLDRPRFGTVRGPIEVAPRRGRATLVAGGDLALGGRVGRVVTERGPDSILGAVLPLLDRADVRVANLESVLTEGSVPAGRHGSFMRGQPSAVALIERAGFDAVTVANNHCLDFGADGLGDTLALLDERGIGHVGAGRGEPAARTPWIAERAGVRLGMLGYCDDFVALAQESGGTMPACARHEAVLEDVSRLRETVDLVVVQLHWGYEFQLYPMRVHRDRARAVVEAGADLVLCHHAHVPMGVERWGHGVIAHGLGNLVFELEPYLRAGHPWTDRSFLLEVEFDRDGVTTARSHPYTIGPDGHVGLVDGPARRRALGALATLSRRLNDDVLLHRIEEDRTAREATLIAHALLSLADGSPEELRELGASLRLPRQAALIDRIGKWPGTARLTALLGAAAAHVGTPEELAVLIREEAGPSLERELEQVRRERCPAPIPPGRVP